MVNRGGPGTSICVGQTIEHVPAQRMAGRQAGMVEVVGRGMGHAEFLHHAAGTEIARHRERNKAGQAEIFKCEVNDGAGSFGSQPLPPIARSQAPANFDSGHKWCVERRDGKADEAEEGLIFAEFGGEEAETVFVKVPLDAGDEIVGELRRQLAGHELHHARTGVEIAKRLNV